jgi:hypothetical protein
MSFNQDHIGTTFWAKKIHPGGWLHIVLGLDRSGEKPYCTFIICIRLHFVNKRLHFIFKRFHRL